MLTDDEIALLVLKYCKVAKELLKNIL